MAAQNAHIEEIRSLIHSGTYTNTLSLQGAVKKGNQIQGIRDKVRYAIARTPVPINLHER
jgi:hypothetical protein